MDTASQVENDLAQTLGALAGQDQGTATARRLSLAADAARGAQAAAERREELHQQARQLAEHGDLAALRHALRHAGNLLADLAGAESRLAGILTHLASHDGSSLAARRRELAAQALAVAQHASNRGQALLQLAQTDEATTPGGTPAADQVGAPAPPEASRERLADIDRRLAELRHARPDVTADDPAPPAVRDARRCTHDAQRHWRQSVAHLQQTRQLLVEALERSATAHDRAASAHDRAARAGIGDVTEHKRMAALDRAAARSDRQQAQKIHVQDDADSGTHLPPQIQASSRPGDGSGPDRQTGRPTPSRP